MAGLCHNLPVTRESGDRVAIPPRSDELNLVDFKVEILLIQNPTLPSRSRVLQQYP